MIAEDDDVNFEGDHLASEMFQELKMPEPLYGAKRQELLSKLEKARSQKLAKIKVGWQ